MYTTAHYRSFVLYMEGTEMTITDYLVIALVSLIVLGILGIGVIGILEGRDLLKQKRISEKVA